MSEENTVVIPPERGAEPKVVVQKRGAGLFRQFLLFLLG